MSPTPPPPGEPFERLLATLDEMEGRLARIEEHARASRSSLGWLVIALVVLPAILIAIAVASAMSGGSLTIG